MGRSKLIVVSADALVGEDLEYLGTLPGYRQYLAGGCRVDRVKSIYPSVTYPCHVTMSTGVYPDRHGVTSNLQLRPDLRPLPWQWFHDVVRVRDLFTAAKEAGRSTAAVFWPVTGQHPDIDYLIDEYWTQGEGDTVTEAFRRAGSSPAMLDIVDRHKAGLVERVHPQADEFLIRCACDIIREHTPDLLMIHPANVDAYRHQTGLFTPAVTRGVEETDTWIGWLMGAYTDAGIAPDDVNLVLTSDHGQLDIRRVVNPNVLLAERNLLQADGENHVTQWDAYCHCNGLSALVYLRDPADEALYKQVYELLCALRDAEVYGIEEVMTTREAKEREHLDGDFSFVLESDGYSSFGDSCSRPYVTGYDHSDYRRGKATHGHLPHKGPWPVFLGKGPAFRPGATLAECRLVDIAPTLAAVLGAELPDCDGRVCEELLRRG